MKLIATILILILILLEQMIGLKQLMQIVERSRLPLVIVVLCFICSNSFGAIIYVANTTQGTGSGADAADAISVQTMNNMSQNAGTVFYLVGGLQNTIGIFANNETVNFMAGASISMTNGQLIYISAGVSGTVINGGVNGLLQNTATGTGLTYSNSSSLINESLTGNFTISNLTFLNQYIHTSTNDASPNISGCGAVYANGLSGTNYIVNCTFSNVGWCINIEGATADFLLVSNCTFANYDHGVVANNVTNIVVTDCAFGSTANWDSVANAYHHDGIHYYGIISPCQSFVISSNQFYGNWGANNTAFIYLETNPKNVRIYNNLFLQYPSNYLDDGMVYATGATNLIYNNTFEGSGVYNSAALTAGGQGSAVENNLFNDLNTFLSVPNAAVPTLNNNLYANQAPGGNSAWATNGAVFTTFAQWQAAVGDTNSIYTAVSTGVVNSNGTIPSGSPAIGAGANLSNIFTTDFAGNLRPSTVPWTIGAYQYVSGGGHGSPQPGIGPLLAPFRF